VHAADHPIESLIVAGLGFELFWLFWAHHFTRRMCHPLLAFGALTLASGYHTDEAVQLPARKRPSGWRLTCRAAGQLVVRQGQ